MIVSMQCWRQLWGKALSSLFEQNHSPESYSPKNLHDKRQKQITINDNNFTEADAFNDNAGPVVVF